MVPRYDEIHETLLALLALRPPQRFLDLGSGTGYTLRRVLEAFPRLARVGLDVSREMLDRARQRLGRPGGPRVDLRSATSPAPELDGSYDAIVSILAVHHLYADEKRHLFSRIWEHIEPGGVFLLADYFRPAMDRLSELYQLPRRARSARGRARPPRHRRRAPRLADRGWASRRSTSSGSTTTSASSSPGARSAEA